MQDTQLQPGPHFSRGGNAHAALGSIWLLADLVAPIVLTIAGLLIYHALLGRFGPFIHPVILLSALGILVAFVTWNRVIHARRTLSRANDLNSLPFAPDDRYRVRVICWPDELDDLQRINPDPFEPERFRALLPDARILDLTRPVQAAGLLTVLPGALSQIIVQTPIWVTGTLLAVLAIVASYLWRLPTYASLSPGKLDIIRYKFGGTRPHHIQQFRLDGPVTISSKGLAQISWTDEQGKKRSLPLALVFNRKNAVRAALAAALSDAQAPEPESY